MKDMEKLQAIDSKVKALKEHKQLTEVERERLREENEFLR